MDTTLSHEEVTRFEAIEARLEVIEEHLGLSDEETPDEEDSEEEDSEEETTDTLED